MINNSLLLRGPQLQREIDSYRTDLQRARQATVRLPKKASSRILRVPQDFPTISDAVSVAEPGDTILVKPGKYHEAVIIPSNKSSIRILAKRLVILNGRKRLSTAFTIQGNNIEIRGFTIRNYVKSGIQISGAFGCRLISNNIERTSLGNGIRMIAGSFSNLIWKNRITESRMDAIDMRGKNNYIVDNDLSNNRGLGVHLRALGNYVIQNRIYNNNKNGITDRTGLNLIFHNEVAHNGFNGIHETSGFGGAAIPYNRIFDNLLNGIRLDTRDSIILQNAIDNNNQSGVLVNGRRNVLQDNTIINNHDEGVKLTNSGNLLLRNDLRANSPFDIVSLNRRNTFIGNSCQTSLPPGLCRSYGKYSHKVLRVPQQFPSITAAVTAAAPGATILVGDGVYRESVTIPAAKSSIRLIADGKRVILDGQGSLSAAFTIRADNVEIYGFRIFNYVTAGLLDSGIANKLIHNTILLITQGNGITLNRAFSTLIWRNRIIRANQNGISILAMNTWCLENEILKSGANGVLTTEINTVGNTITGNRINNSVLDGISDSAGFNLLLNNSISGNGGDGIHERRSGAGFASILDNNLTLNGRNGLELNNNGNFAANNSILNNKLSNIRITGQYNVIEQNNTFKMYPDSNTTKAKIFTGRRVASSN